MAKKKFDNTLKRRVVQYIIEQNLPVAQMSRMIDVNINTLYSWKRKFGLEFIDDALPLMTENQRISFFQHRIRELKKENSILKKKLSYYTKNF